MRYNLNKVGLLSVGTQFSASLLSKVATNLDRFMKYASVGNDNVGLSANSSTLKEDGRFFNILFSLIFLTHCPSLHFVKIDRLLSDWLSMEHFQHPVVCTEVFVAGTRRIQSLDIYCMEVADCLNYCFIAFLDVY